MTAIPDCDEWEKLAPYKRYKSDIVMDVHHILTEPVCPNVTIRFEIPERAGHNVIATGLADTVEEAITVAVTKAMKQLQEWADMTHIVKDDTNYE